MKKNYKIFVPLVLSGVSHDDGKKYFFDMNEDDLIDGIEINVFQLYDFCNKDWEEVADFLKKKRKKILGVCPLESRGDMVDQGEKINFLTDALISGVDCVDLEYTVNGAEYIERAIECFRKNIVDFEPNRHLVIEYANFQETPDGEGLFAFLDTVFVYNPMFIKVICMVNDPDDNMVFYEIIERYSNENIVAFGMGDMGIESRISSVIRGGFATYGCYDEENATCPGQIFYKDLVEKIMVQGE